MTSLGYTDLIHPVNMLRSQCSSREGYFQTEQAKQTGPGSLLESCRWRKASKLVALAAGSVSPYPERDAVDALPGVSLRVAVTWFRSIFFAVAFLF